MQVNEAFDFLNFFYNKKTGAWFTIPELTLIINRAQLSLFEDLQPKYATSQHIKDALAPFKETENFTTTVSGIVSVTNPEYTSLLDIQTYYNISNRRVYCPVKITNEDERANRLNSQISPPSVSNPFGEQVGQKSWVLYPASNYNGNISFLRKPRAIVYGYDVISGRVIVYNPNTSVQFEWSEMWQNVILMKALSPIGINLTEQDVSQYAELKTAANYSGMNML